MEGVYSSENDELTKKIFSEKNKKVICSFSNRNGFSNPIMWGYYANGFKGVAIEIEIPENKNLKKVSYSSELPKIFSEEEIIKILTTKLNKWKHEKEYRFIIDTEKEFLYKIGEITKVYLGNPYGNTINQKDIIENNKSLKKYLYLKHELEEFLTNKNIKYSDIIVKKNTVIQLNNIR
ncbi:hypothetical protein ACN5PC_09175 [Aliarcobacter butzleri]|uniref:hypothetical protein n=1 Tax=Aliarcobacter butzleri TaxID=28197 RepID=UPI003AF89CA7